MRLFDFSSFGSSSSSLFLFLLPAAGVTEGAGGGAERAGAGVERAGAGRDLASPRCPLPADPRPDLVTLDGLDSGWDTPCFLSYFIKNLRAASQLNCMRDDQQETEGGRGSLGKTTHCTASNLAGSVDVCPTGR